MTLCPWERTLRKVMLQPGRVSLPSSPHRLHLYISLRHNFGGITGSLSLSLARPVSLLSFSSSYLSSISIFLTQFSSNLLIFSLIFFPVSRPHLSFWEREREKGCSRVSELVTRTWTSVICTPPGLWPRSHISRGSLCNSLISATSSSPTSCCCTNVNGHRAVQSCVIFFEV